MMNDREQANRYGKILSLAGQLLNTFLHIWVPWARPAQHEHNEAHLCSSGTPCLLGKRCRSGDSPESSGSHASALELGLSARQAFPTPALPWLVSHDVQPKRRRTSQSSPDVLGETLVTDEVAIDLRDSDSLPSPAVRVPGNSELCRQLHGLQCLYPLDQKLGVVALTPEDLDTLEDDNYVNDSIMDFYIKRIQADLDTATSQRLLFFNTFFYKKLTERSGEGAGSSGAAAEVDARAAYERVRKWTKNVDVFQAEYIFVPVHDSAHWSLAVICSPGQLLHDESSSDTAEPASRPALPWQTGERQASERTQGSSGAGTSSSSQQQQQQPWLLHLDPLSGSAHDTAAIADNLTQWLTQEWAHRVRGSRPALHLEPRAAQAPTPADEPSTSEIVDLTGPSVHFGRVACKVAQMPRQANYHDCGLFVLTYMEFFSACPPLRLSCGLNGSSATECSCSFSQGPDWWQASSGGQSRQRIKRAWRDAFLRADWFPTHNPASLRLHIKREILMLMQHQTDPWESTLQRQHAADMVVAIDDAIAREPGSAYVKPDPYFQLNSNAIAVPSDSDSDS